MRILTLFLLVTLAFTPSCRAQDKILDIQKVQSPMGLTAWLVEDKTLPILSLQFSFRGAGAIQDGKEKQGRAQLLSNTMDEGAGDILSQAFQKQLSDHSITLSFHSSRDNFGGQLKTLSRHQDKAVNLLKLALTQPRFDAEPVERMRQSNLTRIRSSMGDPDWIAARLFNDIVFSNHPYALNSGGTLTTLQNITPQDLKVYAKKFLTKDNLVIGVTGNISAKKLAPMLDHIFGALPQTGAQNKVDKLTPPQESKTYLFNKDIPQTIIKMSLPSIDRHDPDYYSLRVLNHIFGAGGFGSRLMNEAREKKGLTYGIYSQLFSLDYVDSLIISTSTKNETVAEMRKIIHAEILKMATQTISKDELQHAKDYIIGSMPLALTSTDNISSILLGLQLHNRPIEYLDNLSMNINKVTIEDVQRVSKRLLDTKKLTTIMVGNPENISNIIEIKEIPNVE